MDKQWVDNLYNERLKKWNENKDKLIKLTSKANELYDVGYTRYIKELISDDYRKITCACVGLEVSSSFYMRDLDKKGITLMDEINNLASEVTNCPYRGFFDRYLDSDKLKVEGNIIITDPCYIIKTDDDTFNLENLGIKSITHDTLIGDWYCVTVDNSSKEILGKFCADAGLVCVAQYDDILKYNPDFEEEVGSHMATCIKDFKGTVQILVKEEEYEYEGKIEKDYYVTVVGNGINTKTGKEFNFHTYQWGF